MHTPAQRLRSHLQRILAVAVAMISASMATAQDDTSDWLQMAPPSGEVTLQAPGEEASNFETLTRGPLHEAFGAATGHEPEAGRIVTRRPPEPVDELPPETPEELKDRSPIWIPGYWAWDEEREDYLWISGAWRVAPESRDWQPGYWAEVDKGFQWVAGYWTAPQAAEPQFFAQPPASLEQGPSIEAPSKDHFWIPGNWVHGDPGWQWQPGNWCAYRESRVWVPSYWLNTPSGCIFVPGYWDYPLRVRGCLYAPVYFPRPCVTAYRPACPLQTDHLLMHLFVNRYDHHYYFGDYYDVAYRNRGCYPIYQYRQAACRFDPLYTYYNVHYRRRGIDCYDRFRSWNNYYVQNTRYRPPRTLSAQLTFNVGNAGISLAYSKLACPRPPRRPAPGLGYAHRVHTQAAVRAKQQLARAQRDNARRLAEQRRRREALARKANVARIKKEQERAKRLLAERNLEQKLNRQKRPKGTEVVRTRDVVRTREVDRDRRGPRLDNPPRLGNEKPRQGKPGPGNRTRPGNPRPDVQTVVAEKTITPKKNIVPPIKSKNSKSKSTSHLHDNRKKIAEMRKELNRKAAEARREQERLSKSNKIKTPRTPKNARTPRAAGPTIQPVVVNRPQSNPTNRPNVRQPKVKTPKQPRTPKAPPVAKRPTPKPATRNVNPSRPNSRQPKVAKSPQPSSRTITTRGIRRPAPSPKPVAKPKSPARPKPVAAKPKPSRAPKVTPTRRAPTRAPITRPQPTRKPSRTVTRPTTRPKPSTPSRPQRPKPATRRPSPPKRTAPKPKPVRKPKPPKKPKRNKR